MTIIPVPDDWPLSQFNKPTDSPGVPLLDTSCLRGERVRTVNGDVGRFIGITLQGVPWVARDDRDFELMCSAFDSLSQREAR